jgi:DHA2 family multidrug resistance protein|tara:strand:- start:106271 stop:107821 length:1551 start_codon:yes stop_codon:yes gene_type:complete
MPAADRSIVGQANTPVAHRGLLTIGVMLATVMQVLDSTIANVALPHMQASLGATVDTITWVLTSYIVASAIAIPITGWLADRVGARNLFLFSAIGFVGASMLCGIATSLEEMVAFRVLQGIAGAFIGPLSQTVLLDINPPERHGKAMSIWGMGVMIGPITGPVLGGLLTENYSWRWVFYVNLPIGILCVALLWWLLPRRPPSRRSFDLFGFSMLALGLAALQLLLDRGQGEDWLHSTEILIEIGVAVAALWVFGIHMATAKSPMFSRVLLTDRNLMTSLLFMIVIGVMMFATMALLPTMLQQLYGYPVIDTGLLLAPRGIGVLISMALAGQLMGRVDSRWLIGFGMILAAVSLWWMTTWSLEMGWWPIVTSGFVQGLGMGFVFIPLNTLAFATLPPSARTDGSSLLNLLRSVGASIGISVVSTFLARNLQVSHADLSAHVTSYSIFSFDPQQATRFGEMGNQLFALIDAEISRQALMIAYLDDFWLIMWLSMAAIPLVFLLKRAPLQAGSSPAVIE